MGQCYYDESTFQNWVASHVSREANLDEIPVTHLRKLYSRYREEIESIPTEDALIATLDHNQPYEGLADVVKTKNAIRYYLGS